MTLSESTRRNPSNFNFTRHALTNCTRMCMKAVLCYTVSIKIEDKKLKNPWVFSLAKLKSNLRMITQSLFCLSTLFPFDFNFMFDSDSFFLPISAAVDSSFSFWISSISNIASPHSLDAPHYIVAAAAITIKNAHAIQSNIYKMIGLI